MRFFVLIFGLLSIAISACASAQVPDGPRGSVVVSANGVGFNYRANLSSSHCDDGVCETVVDYGAVRATFFSASDQSFYGSGCPAVGPSVEPFNLSQSAPVIGERTIEFDFQGLRECDGRALKIRYTAKAGADPTIAGSIVRNTYHTWRTCISSSSGVTCGSAASDRVSARVGTIREIVEAWEAGL